MAVEINWSEEAEATFANNVTYLQTVWTEREAARFIQQTEKVVKQLQQHPESYPPGKKNKKYRCARLNKYMVLFYRYHKAKEEITLLTFWNTKQDPGKLKY